MRVSRGNPTVAETVADNVRAYRQIRGIDQADLAERMKSFGAPWRQVTVSEVERNQRNVTVSELVTLVFALEATIEQLLDTRGPEGRRGPRLSLSEGAVKVSEDDEPAYRVLGPALPPEHVTALVCSHKAYIDIEWDEQQHYKRLEVIPEGSVS
jgi:transcriptional regulator with XRE-family HTH domain